MADEMFAIPDDASEPVKREFARFMKAYRKHLDRLKTICLTILVWGQSPSRDTLVSRKRKEIKEVLLNEGYNTLFSEDIDPSIGEGFSEKTKELAQAKEAHLVIVLIEDAPGASAELHDFSAYEDLQPKFLVMVPRRYSEGYSGKGAIANLDAAYGNIFWYGEHDLSDCTVRKKALQKAQAMRELLFQAKKTRR